SPLDGWPQRLHGDSVVSFSQGSGAIKAAVNRWDPGWIPASTQLVGAAGRILPEHVPPHESLPCLTIKCFKNLQQVLPIEHFRPFTRTPSHVSAILQLGNQSINIVQLVGANPLRWRIAIQQLVRLE